MSPQPKTAATELSSSFTIQAMSAMDYEIQLLNEANSDLLSRAGAEVFDNPIDTRQLQAFLADARHVMFVALDNDTVVGMASAVEYFHPDKPPQLWINELGVATTHRKQGIGRSLVNALLKTAGERSCVSAWLGTDVDNNAAQACFDSIPEVEEPQRFILYEWDLEE